MSHKHHDHAHLTAMSASDRHIKPLLITLGLTVSYMVIQVAVALWTGSLALLADSAHMFTDVLGIAMAATALLAARRSVNPQRTYGLYRLEVLAGLANGALLIAVAVYVAFEAVVRWNSPVQIPGKTLFVTAALGLAINLVGFWLLRDGQEESLAVRGAYLEVAADALGSAAVIVAATVIWLTGWTRIDTILGIAIGLWILPRTLRLMTNAVHILIEAAPRHVNVEAVRHDIQAVPGVVNVHDLHIWTVTSGFDAATAHAVIDNTVDHHNARHRIAELMSEQYNISHVTIQCEDQEENMNCHQPAKL